MTTTEEGFVSRSNTTTDNGNTNDSITIYDKFYATIYDSLFFNEPLIEYELEQICKHTGLQTTIDNSTANNFATKSVTILDVGCSTGHVVAALDYLLNAPSYKHSFSKSNSNTNTKTKTKSYIMGVDNSTAMIDVAKDEYPHLATHFFVGDVLHTDADPLFDRSSFTHILCLYFTVYYFKNQANMQQFFQAVYDWLQPGGYFVLHLVDPHKFDPILASANPLIYVSPQRYAPRRITNSIVHFNQFKYTADFEWNPNNNQAQFIEHFYSNNASNSDNSNPNNQKQSQQTRKNTHVLYMPPITQIASWVLATGFQTPPTIIDLVTVQYEYQYLYIFHK